VNVVLSIVARWISSRLDEDGAEEMVTALLERYPPQWLVETAWREGYAQAGIDTDPLHVHRRPWTLLPPWVTDLPEFEEGREEALRAAALWEESHPRRDATGRPSQTRRGPGDAARGTNEADSGSCRGEYQTDVQPSVRHRTTR